jgi:hypothetical protein
LFAKEITTTNFFVTIVCPLTIRVDVETDFILVIGTFPPNVIDMLEKLSTPTYKHNNNHAVEYRNAYAYKFLLAITAVDCTDQLRKLL